MEAWVVLGLGCALGTAITDILTKRTTAFRTLHEAIVLRTILPTALLLPLLFFIELPQVHSNAAGWLVPAWMLEVLALHWYVNAVRSGVLGHTLPWLALTPGLSYFSAWLLLDEHLSWKATAGLFLVVAGCFIAYCGKPEVGNVTDAQPEVEEHRCRRAMWQMAGVAVIYAVTPVLAKIAMGNSNPLSFGILYYGGVAGCTAISFLLRLRWSPIVTIGAVDWVIAVFIAAVVLMHYSALQLAAVPTFLALKRLNIVFAAVFAALFLREQRLSGWLASLTVVFGAGLIVTR